MKEMLEVMWPQVPNAVNAVVQVRVGWVVKGETGWNNKCVCVQSIQFQPCCNPAAFILEIQDSNTLR